MNLPALKAKLTRAQRSGDPRKVMRACDEAMDTFAREGWPDCWHRWEQAAIDAHLAVRRAA